MESEARTVDVQVVREESREVLRVEAWQFSVWKDLGDGIPRIRDTDAGERLGFARPRVIRELIERIWPENKRPNWRRTVGRQPVGPGGKGIREFEVNEYWLTKAELLKVCARAETAPADAMLDEMIRVYLAVDRWQARLPANDTRPRLDVPVVDAVPDAGPLGGDLRAVYERLVLAPLARQREELLRVVDERVAAAVAALPPPPVPQEVVAVRQEVAALRLETQSNAKLLVASARASLRAAEALERQGEFAFAQTAPRPAATPKPAPAPDPWLPKLRAWTEERAPIVARPWFVIDEAFGALGIGPSERTKAAENRVGTLLRELGFRSRRRTLSAADRFSLRGEAVMLRGDRVYAWEKASLG